MKKQTLFLVTALAFLAVVAPVSAQYAPYQPSTTTVSILVDKKVGNPIVEKGTTSVSYVDNLSETDHRFVANEDVWFQIKVKNTSNAKLTGVTVKDFVPSYVNAVEGPGTYDSSNRVLVVNAGDFEVNEEKTYTFKMRVMGADHLPTGINCISNRAQGYNNNVSDDDTAQLCIEKAITTTVTTTTKGGMPPVKHIPQTGPEQGILLYAVSTVLGALGLKLRKSK